MTTPADHDKRCPAAWDTSVKCNCGAQAADEIALIAKTLESVGITSLLNHGAASCVFTEGCAGVSQDHILAYTRKIALHCAVALAAPPTAQAEGWRLVPVDATEEMVTKSKLLAQPVAWMVYLPSIDTQNVYDSQDDPGYVDDVTNHADAEVTPLYEMAAPKAEVVPAGEYPAGAIANGRTHIDRLESHYRFDCEAGPLSDCGDWYGLKRCFEQLAAAPQTDRQPAVQQWNDLIGKETHADADGLLVWRDEVDFAIPTPQADSQPAKVELFNPLEGGNLETELQMAAVIALRDSQPALPEITAEDRSFLHYNPNTDDIVEWVQHYASAAITADRAMRAKAAPAAAAGQCEDAIELLGKYKELCEEIKRGDSYHIGRIDAAISVLAQAAPQPAVQQGDADVEGAIKSAFFRFFGAGAERDWHTEPGSWFIEGYRAAHPAAPVAQGDAEDGARYRFLAEHCRSTSEHWGGRWSIVVEGPAPESHDSKDDFDAAIDAARAQSKEGGAA